MVDLCRTRFTPETSPAGFEVAKVFPWWSTAYQEITDNNSINDKFVIRAPSGNRQAFANDKPWPIYIDELRFWTTEEEGTSNPIKMLEGMMERTCFKIRTDLQQDIIHKW
ncbi:MAG: hypothetical protein KAJ19_19500, partial [Gammaproteobacteria bacterium]|nr:hypothetical protein [Gammaproteobacteria bacterium]